MVVITTTEAAKMLGVTVQHLRLLIRLGRIEATRYGERGVWLVNRASVEQYRASVDQAARKEQGT